MLDLTSDPKQMQERKEEHDKLFDLISGLLNNRLVDRFIVDFIRIIVYAEKTYADMQPFIPELLKLIEFNYPHEFAFEMN